MSRIIILILFIVIYGLRAQVLDVSEKKTFIYTVSTSPKLHSVIKNLSDEEQTFTIKRRDLELPEGWESFFCFKSCFPSMIEEVSVSLGPGESELLQIDYAIDAEKSKSGVGIVQMTIQSETNPDEVYIRTYGVSYGATKDEGGFKLSVNKAALVTPLPKGADHTILLENSSDEDQEITLSWERVAMKDEWELSICLDVCLPPFVTSTDLSIAGEETKEIKIHVTPDDSGVGVVQYNVALKGDEPVTSLLFAYPTIGEEAVIAAGVDKAPVTFVKRRGNLLDLNLDEKGRTAVLLYNSKGQEIASLYRSRVTNENTISLAIPTLGAGVYYLHVVNGTSSYALPLSIQ